MIYFSWATQIILAIISFLWLIPYYIAFKVGNRKYMSKTLDLSCNNSVNSTLAVSNIRNRTYTNCEVYLIDYGYGNFKEKIHFME